MSLGCPSDSAWPGPNRGQIYIFPLHPTPIKNPICIAAQIGPSGAISITHRMSLVRSVVAPPLPDPRRGASYEPTAQANQALPPPSVDDEPRGEAPRDIGGGGGGKLPFAAPHGVGVAFVSSSFVAGFQDPQPLSEMNTQIRHFQDSGESTAQGEKPGARLLHRT